MYLISITTEGSNDKTEQTTKLNNTLSVTRPQGGPQYFPTVSDKISKINGLNKFKKTCVINVDCNPKQKLEGIKRREQNLIYMSFWRS